MVIKNCINPNHKECIDIRITQKWRRHRKIINKKKTPARRTCQNSISNAITEKIKPYLFSDSVHNELCCNEAGQLIWKKSSCLSNYVMMEAVDKLRDKQAKIKRLSGPKIKRVLLKSVQCQRFIKIGFELCFNDIIVLKL